MYVRVPVGEYRNVCEWPPIIRLISSTSWANFASKSIPEWLNPMIISTPWLFNCLAASLTDGISGKIRKFSVSDMILSNFLERVCVSTNMKVQLRNRNNNYVRLVLGVSDNVDPTYVSSCLILTIVLGVKYPTIPILTPLTVSTLNGVIWVKFILGSELRSRLHTTIGVVTFSIKSTKLSIPSSNSWLPNVCVKRKKIIRLWVIPRSVWLIMIMNIEINGISDR